MISENHQRGDFSFSFAYVYRGKRIDDDDRKKTGKHHDDDRHSDDRRRTEIIENTHIEKRQSGINEPRGNRYGNKHHEKSQLISQYVSQRRLILKRKALPYKRHFLEEDPLSLFGGLRSQQICGNVVQVFQPENKYGDQSDRKDHAERQEIVMRLDHDGHGRHGITVAEDETHKPGHAVADKKSASPARGKRNESKQDVFCHDTH